jgi:hypothetical protein
MSTFSPPSSWSAAHLELCQVNNNRIFTSPLNGWRQTATLPGARWGWNITFPEQAVAVRRTIEAILSKLNGMEHRLALYDLARPVPSGTCNLAGVTASAAAQFATVLVLAGCGAGKTLLAGDWLSVVTTAGSQLLMVTDDVTADGSGNITCNTRPSLRASVTGGASVTLDHPTGLFVLAKPEITYPREAAGKCPQFGVSLVEVFQ